jgi:N utilization substance protein B
MRLVYQMSVTDDWSPEKEDEFLAEKSDCGCECSCAAENADAAYFAKAMETIRGHLGDIDAAIEGSSDNWKIGRIGKVDLAIIRLAAAEILYMPDIPPAVSVNEAVDLAKMYGTEKSRGFVNGVLGSVVKGASAGRAEAAEATGRGKAAEH